MSHLVINEEVIFQERPAGAEAPGVPPGPPPDYMMLIMEVEKIEGKEGKMKEKKNLRFSDLPDEGPPGEVRFDANSNYAYTHHAFFSAG